MDLLVRTSDIRIFVWKSLGKPQIMTNFSTLLVYGWVFGMRIQGYNTIVKMIDDRLTLLTFIWKTRWIYMVEEFINILRVSAMTCFFGVSSSEKLLLSKLFSQTIFPNLNIFGILKLISSFVQEWSLIKVSKKIYHLKSRCFARCLHFAIISDLLFSELKWSWWSANINIVNPTWTWSSQNNSCKWFRKFVRVMVVVSWNDWLKLFEGFYFPTQTDEKNFLRRGKDSDFLTIWNQL